MAAFGSNKSNLNAMEILTRTLLFPWAKLIDLLKDAGSLEGSAVVF
jgi:hypothetical protein